MREFLSGKKFNLLFSALAIVVLWAAWLIAYAAVGNDYVVPSFWDAMKSLGALFAEGFFWRSLGMTFLRAAEGWALAFVCAVLTASLAAVSGQVRAFLAPVVAVLRCIPTLAITLMLLLWAGAGTAPVIVTFLMLFPVSYAQLTAAYAAIDPKLFEMSQVYRLSRRERIFRIVVPQMLPSLFAQAGPNLSLALKVAVSAEVLAFTYVSVGGMMTEANSYLQIPRLFALTIAVLLLGGLLEFALGNLTRITDRWKKGREGRKEK